MSKNVDDYFVNQIAKKTGLDRKKIQERIKDDTCYPTDKTHEGDLAFIVDKFAWLAKIIDKMVEKTPMTFDEIMNATDEMIEHLGISERDMEVTGTFYNCIKTLYQDEIDDNLSVPSSVEDLGEGVIMIRFNRVLPEFREKWATPEEKADDYIANEPFSLLFIDTTPGVVGFRAFFTKLGG